MIADASNEIVLDGIASAPGIAIGPAFIYWGADLLVEKVLVETKKELDSEIKKFRSAADSLLDELKAIKETTTKSYGEKIAELFELQIGLLQDEILLQEIEDKILSEKINATYAIFQILRDKKNYFLNLQNEYFRDRAYEVQDLKQKLIAKIEGTDSRLLQDKPSIVFAHDLTPADTMRLFQKHVLGYVTEMGGINSHAAIMAKALDIPSVAGCENVLTQVKKDDLVVVDGFNGTVIINPSEDTLTYYRQMQEKYERTLNKIRKTIHKDTKTLDGQPIYVDANIEFIEELDVIRQYKANGIGLFRTESLFLQSTVLPSEDEQMRVYSTLADSDFLEHVTIRTLDLGGDKVLPELQSYEEMNPFLGWRAIRFCLDMPEIFRTQIRAILRANQKGKIRILLPFVSTYDEIIRSREIIKEEQERLFGHNGNKLAIKLGLMIETPAAARMADVFAEEVDFFSIGTNDLTQYVMAVDRNNQRIAKLYSSFDPAVLRFVRDIIQAALDKKIEVEMCGEMAGNPLAIPLLIGFGLRTFSVGHSKIPVVKMIASRVSVPDVEQMALEVLKLKTASSVEKVLQIYFKDKFPELQTSQL